MSKKIKVLTLSDHPLFPSGVAHQSKLMIEALLKTGDFEVVSLGGAIEHPDYRPVQLEEYGEDWIIYPVKGYGTPENLRSVIRMHKPDILWFMTDPRYFVWLWEMEDEIRSLMPMVYYHVWDNKPLPTFNEPYYSSTDVIATISKTTDEIVREVAPKVERHYIPHAVDSECFKKKELDIKEFKKKYFGDENKFVFFWNNRNARRKQSGSLIFWYKAFLDKVGHDKCVLLMHTQTRDPNGQNLTAVTNHLGLNNGEVMFSEKRMPSEELATLYNVADVTINISDAEGFGLSVVESLSCETPVLVNLTGGMIEQVTADDGTYLGHGLEPVSKAVIGSQDVPFIYEDRLNEESVVEGLMKLYSMSDEERKELGKKARQHVLDNFSFKKFNESWVEVMKNVHEKYGSWDERKNYQSWELVTI